MNQGFADSCLGSKSRIHHALRSESRQRTCPFSAHCLSRQRSRNRRRSRNGDQRFQTTVMSKNISRNRLLSAPRELLSVYKILLIQVGTVKRLLIRFTKLFAASCGPSFPENARISYTSLKRKRRKRRASGGNSERDRSSARRLLPHRERSPKCASYVAKNRV